MNPAPLYLRCVELDPDDLRVTSPTRAHAITRRALILGANALCAPTGKIPTALSHAATSAGLHVVAGTGPSRRHPMLQAPDATWPDGPPGNAATLLARRHRTWPNALAWVRSPRPDADAEPNAAVPSNVVATVRRMAGHPGQGFSAPWPELPHDPAWAPTTVLPEPPPARRRPGRGFAVNLWLCCDRGASRGAAEVTATARWGDRVHSWRFSGPIPATEVVTIGTLPLVRPVDNPLSLELRLATDSDAGATPPTAWRYALVEDAAGVPFWSPSTPDE